MQKQNTHANCKKRNGNSMRILTLENESYNIDHIPTKVDDLRFCVLDNSNIKEPDFYFKQLIFLESFNSPALVIKIGKTAVTMPIDWQILIGEPDQGDLEVVPLTSINDRGFKGFVFNPINGFRTHFVDIEIVDVFQDIRWYAPKIKPNSFLAVPINDDPTPLCAYFIRDVNKQNEVVNYSKLW